MVPRESPRERAREGHEARSPDVRGVGVLAQDMKVCEWVFRQLVTHHF